MLNPFKTTPVSNIDNTALQNYNTLLLQGKTEEDAMASALNGANAETKAMATSLNQLNAQRRAGLLTDEQYTTQLNGMIVQTEQLTFAQRASAVASKAMGVALNLALNVGIGIAISAIISLISKAVNAQKELKRKAEEMKKEILEDAEAAKEEAKSLQELTTKYNELASNTELMASNKEELSTLQSELIEKYGAEADGIDLVNGKYDEMIARLKNLTSEQIKQNLNKTIAGADIAADAYHDNEQNTIKQPLQDSKKTIGQVVGFSDALNSIDGVKFFSTLTDELQNYSEEQIKEMYGDIASEAFNIDNAIQIDGNLNSEEKQKVINQIQEVFKERGFTEDFDTMFSELNSEFTHYGKEAATYSDYMSSLANQLFTDYTSNANNDIGKVTEDNFDGWKQGLLDYTKGLYSGDEYDAIVKNFNDIFKTNNVLFQTSNTGETVKVYQSLSSAITTAKENLEGYKETSNSLTDSTKTLNDALSEQISDGGLSLDTVKSLQEKGYDTAVKYDEVLNKYVLNTEKAKEISEQNLSSAINSLVAEKASLTTSYNAEMKNTTVSSPQSASDVPNYNEYKTSQEDKKISLTNDYNNAISELDNQLGFLKITQDEVAQSTNKYKLYVDEAKSSVEKYSGVLSEMDDNASTINSAWKEQNDDGKLSVDTITKLIEAGYESAICFDKQTGSATLLQGKMQELVNAQLAQHQAEILSQQTDLTKKYEESAKAVDTYSKSINSASDAQIYNNAIANKNSLQAELDKLGVLSDSYKGVYNDIWTLDDKSSSDSKTTEDKESAEDIAQKAHDAHVDAFEKEKSDLDHLKDMQVISDEDYYSQLLQLVRQYYYGKSEYLDEYKEQEKELFDNYKDLEKEALQNQIDMLQEANDEREEAISLEEKKIALENAQKQKIKTYSTETGFTYTQDKQAIADAQKDYNDELVSQQIDTLEKLKDSIDTNTNTAHTSDESADVLSQVSSVTGVNAKELIKPSEMSPSQFMDWVKNFDMTKLSNVLNNSIVPTLPNVAMTTPNTQNITNNNNNNINLTMGNIITNDANSFTKSDFPKALSDGLTDFFTQAESYNITHK